MQVVKNILLGLVVFWFGILVLMPKQGFYYKLEEQLNTQGIQLNEKVIKESWFGLNLGDVSLYVKGIKIATIEKIELMSLLFYTTLEVKGVHLDDSFKAMMPQDVEEIEVRHSVLNPLLLSIDANASFAVITGEVEVMTRKVHLELNETKGIEMLQPHLKPQGKGWVYERVF